MKLTITRSQEGQPATLKAQCLLVLSAAEQQLYDLYGFPRATGDDDTLGERLLKGMVSKTARKPTEMYDHEDKICTYCRQVADYWRASAAYDGTEDVSFDTSPPGATP